MFHLYIRHHKMNEHVSSSADSCRQHCRHVSANQLTRVSYSTDSCQQRDLYGRLYYDSENEQDEHTKAIIFISLCYSINMQHPHQEDTPDDIFLRTV